jgi:hypothetical protein
MMADKCTERSGYRKTDFSGVLPPSFGGEAAALGRRRRRRSAAGAAASGARGSLGVQFNWFLVMNLMILPILLTTPLKITPKKLLQTCSMSEFERNLEHSTKYWL